MRLQNNRVVRTPGVRALARLARREGTGVAGAALATRAARVGVARVRRAMDLAVARSPQSLFLRELVAQPASVGAICASSPRLAARMAALVGAHPSGLVVELGGGTGVITAALLAHGVPPHRLVVVEQSAALAEHLRRRFPDVCVLQGDAAELTDWHAAGRMPAGQDGLPQPIHTIVSGLPLLSIPAHSVEAILAGAFAYLRPGASVYQFTYGPRCPVPRAVMERLGLQAHRVGRTVRNLPPAAVYRITRYAESHA